MNSVTQSYVYTSINPHRIEAGRQEDREAKRHRGGHAEGKEAEGHRGRAAERHRGGHAEGREAERQIEAGRQEERHRGGLAEGGRESERQREGGREPGRQRGRWMEAIFYRRMLLLVNAEFLHLYSIGNLFCRAELEEWTRK